MIIFQISNYPFSSIAKQHLQQLRTNLKLVLDKGNEYRESCNRHREFNKNLYVEPGCCPDLAQSEFQRCTISFQL